MKRINKSTPDISLFPMFNILICTLGVLIFILGAVTAVSLGIGKTISVIPDIDHSKHNLIPNYIEWDGSKITLHPSMTMVTFSKNIRDIKTYQETYKYIDKSIAGTEIEKLLKDI